MNSDEAGLAVLRGRVAALDSGHRPWVRSVGAAGLIEHLIAVLQIRAASSTVPVGAAAVDPAVADELVAMSRTVQQLAAEWPELVTGPMRRDAQRWVSTGRHAPPTPAAVVAPTPLTWGAKPFGVGLFTSTAGPGGRGSWRVYLDDYETSALHPPPWTEWTLVASPQGRIRELTGARDWAALVADYPAVRSGTAAPDWVAVADDYDGVHVTYAAVVAIQAVPIHTAVGPTAPCFWDVESTFWLRWCFTSVNR